MSVKDEARATHEWLGGRASAADVARNLRKARPDLYESTTWAGWMSAVRSGLNQKTGIGALPYSVSVSVDGEDTYVQTALLDPDEYRGAIATHMRMSHGARETALALARECERVHGIWIDPDIELRNEHADWFPLALGADAR